jgi:DNA gyrase subunit B
VASRAASDAYTADNLTVLEGLEAVQKRPGMYIGSTDIRGVMKCLWEIISNGVDEALAGSCDRIEITLHPDGSVEVYDTGRGIPVDTEKRTGLSGVELIFTRLHAGGKFGGISYTASGGLHGVGASVVNALSERLDVVVERAPTAWGMTFKRGLPGVFAGDGPSAKFTKRSGLDKLGRVKKGISGTRIRYWLDRQLFVTGATVDYDALVVELRQTSFLVPGLTLSVIDLRGAEPRSESFRHDGGITEFVEYLTPGAPITDVIRLTGEGQFTETVPVLDEQGHLHASDVDRTLEVDVAVRWMAGYDTEVQSFVNVIHTGKGGTHVAGFERGLTSTMNALLRDKKVLRISEESVVKDDVLEGLIGVVTVRFAEPQFEGQTKEVLGTPEAARIVGKVVTDGLREWFGKPPRGQTDRAKQVLDKIAGAARTRLAARQQRDDQRRKNALESSSLPTKLYDCRSTAAERTELFIVEGDSALGTAKPARSSEFQALLPIRGKILNVQKASVADMLRNVECASIIQVIGAGSGRSFDLDASRYGKVILMADADFDGAHIRCLLITLFYTYMRPLVDAGRLYSAVPPLHRIELVNPKKGMDKYLYTYSDPDLQRRLVDLERRGIRWRDNIQRYKGLGEMDAQQLSETTMDPRRRTLRRIRVEDAEAATDMFALLMGNDVGPRRDFLAAGAYEVDEQKIDV